MPDVPESEPPGRHVSVQQNGRDFNASFRKYDVGAVFVAQAGRSIGWLSWRYNMHRRYGHADGHDARVVRPQMFRVEHSYARVVYNYDKKKAFNKSYCSYELQTNKYILSIRL